MATAVKHPDRTALNWLLVGGSLVTLFIWASVEDPFNAPKSWILYSVAFWLFGWVGFQVKARWRSALDRSVLVFSGIFTLTLSLAFLATDVKLQGFLGDYARRTGFLAYFSLVILFVAAAFLVNHSNIALFDRITLVVGFVVGAYGCLQHFKLDFIKWNNPYNSVISTLGNPDFAAAVMAIFMVLSVGLLFNAAKALRIRVWAFFNLVILLVTILFSQVRQGLLAGGIGIGIVAVVWVYQRKKIVALMLIALGALGVIGGLLGMLNKGPLKSFFYKASVTYRGDYWRAGIRMFKGHPWFGVGLDRYGAYFRTYRDVNQALRNSPDTVSNAAHNVPIQLAATGGIFVFVAYLSLSALILWRGIIGLKKSSSSTQILIVTYLAAWITYQAQSFVSIDNLGIAVWGWILGGVVVALSKDSMIDIVEEKSTSHLSSKTKNKARVAKKKVSFGPAILVQPLVSAMLFVAALALVIPMYLADSSLKTLRGYAAPTSQNAQPYLELARKPLGYGFQDAHVKTSVAILIAQAGMIAEGKADLLAVLASDPHSYDSLITLASIDEQTKNTSEAVGYRRRIASLDPWNYTNLLRLGEDLKSIGDKSGAKVILSRIVEFASTTADAKTARQEL